MTQLKSLAPKNSANLQSTILLGFVLLLIPLQSFSQVWYGNGDILTNLGFYDLESSDCLENPNDYTDANAVVNDIEAYCHNDYYVLIPDAPSHGIYCVSTYNQLGQLTGNYHTDVIKVHTDEPTYYVITNQQGDVYGGYMIPYAPIEVKNVCDKIKFTTHPFFHLNVNGQDVAANSYEVIIEDIYDYDVVEELVFNVEVRNNSAYNNMNCADKPKITYNYIPACLDVIGDTTICEGESVEFYSSLFHETFIYEWSLGDGLDNVCTIHDVQADTSITLTVTDTVGCSRSAEIAINTSSVEFDLGADLILQLGDEFVSCVPSPQGETWSYWWNNGQDGHCNMFEPTENTMVWLEVFNEHGCGFSDTMMIGLITEWEHIDEPIEFDDISEEEEEEDSEGDEFEEEPHIKVEVAKPDTSSTDPVIEAPTYKIRCKDLYIPNVISPTCPNEDNRHFRVFSGEPIKLIERAVITDRWGGLVVSKSSLNQDVSIWNGMKDNGTTYETGVYTYWLNIEVSHDEWLTCKGDITLLP